MLKFSNFGLNKKILLNRELPFVLTLFSVILETRNSKNFAVFQNLKIFKRDGHPKARGDLRRNIFDDKH